MQRSLHLKDLSSLQPSDALPAIESLLEEMAEAEAWPMALTMRANLVLEELVLNALTHGAGGNLTEISLELESQGNVLAISLSDDGAPFNPLVDAPVPDTTLALDEREIGGLGVHLVKSMGQDLEYRREDDRNHLKLAIHPE